MAFSSLKTRTSIKRTPFKIKVARSHSLARKSAKAYRLKSRGPSKEDLQWAKAVRERDGNRCRWPGCDYESESIHAHHIHTRKQRPDLRHDPNNGASLCPRHHDELHHTVEGRKRGRELGLLGTKTYEKAMKERAA